uniref:Uncharacterized protein n=1 Tax=Oryza rufipogon TaxID=4529 RepID=A0A0E0QAS3_ORYRU
MHYHLLRLERHCRHEDLTKGMMELGP